MASSWEAKLVLISKASDEQKELFANSVDKEYNQDCQTYRKLKKVSNHIGLECRT